jgi:hypothetical protein
MVRGHHGGRQRVARGRGMMPPIESTLGGFHPQGDE